MEKKDITLRRLKEVVDLTLQDKPDYYNPDIAIVVSERGFPSTPCVKVKGVSMGFDWDNNFMIRAEVPLCRKKKDTPLRKKLAELTNENENLRYALKRADDVCRLTQNIYREDAKSETNFDRRLAQVRKLFTELVENK